MLSFKNIDTKLTYTIAHRGASAYKHENSLEAFQKAIDLQADAIELDVRKTFDDVLVVHHDSRLKGFHKSIAKMSYIEIYNFNMQAEYKVPTLEEVLQLCSGKISLDIELKETGYEKSVVALALKYYNIENLLFTSFYKKTLYKINEISRNLVTGYLFHKPMLIKSIPEYVDFLLPHYQLCKIGYLKKLESLGKPIIVWTVDKELTKNKFIQKYIFGIITNNPT